MSTDKLFYSVIIPVGTRVDDLRELITEYASALEAASVGFEIIVVLDGLKAEVLAQLQDLSESQDWMRIVQFSRTFGQSAALMAGFSEARGEKLITLPAYWQVAASELPKFLQSATEGDDVLIAVRSPRAESRFERIRRGLFHGMLKVITALEFRDLGCSVRLFKRKVAEEIALYGDQYRFLPLLAVRRGFSVREVELAQSPADNFRGRYRLREYLHGILDVMTVFFLVRFTKKPLRFFGSIGALAGGIGAIFVLVMVIQRLFFDMALAERPALLLASLLIVLGVQLFGLGLLGELVIFSHAGESKEYAIRSIVGARALEEDECEVAAGSEGKESDRPVIVKTS